MDKSQSIEFNTLTQSALLIDQQIMDKNIQLANAHLEIQQLKAKQIENEEKLTLKINKLELIISQKNGQINQLEKSLKEHGNFELIFELEEKLEKAEQKIQQMERELYCQEKSDMQKKNVIKRTKRCSLISTFEYDILKGLQNNLQSKDKAFQNCKTFQDQNFEKLDEILSLKSEQKKLKMNSVIDKDMKLDLNLNDDQEISQTLQKQNYFDLANQLQEELKTELEINIKNEQKIKSFQELSLNLENKIDKYENQIQSQKMEILKLLEDLDQERHNNYQLKEEKKDLQSQIKFQSEKIENFDLQKSQNFQNFEELLIKHDFLNSEIKRLKQEKNEQHNEDLNMIKQINNINQDLEIKMIQKDKRIKDLEFENQKLMDQIQNQAQKIAIQKKRLQEKNQEIEQKISEVEFYWKNRLENIQRERKITDGVYISMKDENIIDSENSEEEQADISNHDIKDQIKNKNQLQNEQKNNQENQNKNEMTEKQIQDYLKKRQSIQSQWQSYENLIQQVKSINSLNIKAEIDLAEQQIKRLNEKVDLQQNEIQELRRKLIKAQQNKDSISLQQHKNEIKSLNIKIENLKKLCEASQSNSQISHTFGQKYLKLYENLFEKYKTDKINFSNELSKKEQTIYKLTKSYKKLKNSLN